MTAVPQGGAVKRLSLFVGFLVSSILVVGGAALFIVSTQMPASFGWFAYQPIAGSVFSPSGIVVLTQSAIVGATLIVCGLVGLAAATGFSLGKRRVK